MKMVEVENRKGWHTPSCLLSRVGWSALAVLILPVAVAAQVRWEGTSNLNRLAFASGRLSPPTDDQLLEASEGLLQPAVSDAWAGFAGGRSGKWQGYVSRRNGFLSYAEGAGIAWIPGFGNALREPALGTGALIRGQIRLATLELTARDFLATHGALLGIVPEELVLNLGRSGQVADYLWYVEFDVVRGGLPIEGARVLFRVNNGNLIQFGTENLPGPTVPVPEQKLDRDAAFRVLADYVGGIDPGFDVMVDSGSLLLIPAAPILEGTGLPSAFGDGMDLVKAWQFTFRRPGVVGTFRGRVDATTGELIEFLDVNDYAVAQVTGGSHVGDDLPPDTIVAMPFANVSGLGFTNSAGIYTYTSGTITSTLNGQYVRIVDTCGAISQSSVAGGNIAFGFSSGTDCTTPGSGGAGNTRASRTQFYNVNRAKETGRGWLPSNVWLNAQLTVNVNITQACNAYWSPTTGTLNFLRSGGGCANTGELPGVSLHEWGHGMDSNDGSGATGDNGTGETYGDFSAALSTHASCIGRGFLSSTCGYGSDSCNSCTGVRDIDYAQHSVSTPHTVENYTRVICPQPSGSNPNYVGPCGRDAMNRGVTANKREGHCESGVSSEALWDFAARDLPSPGSGSAWSTTDRLWYLSRGTATTAFQCNTSATPWTSDGCNVGSNWRTMRAADDDNGNLADGTPHSCNLYAAFNRHLIACISDTGANTCFSGCTPPATPTLTATPGGNQVALSWTSSGAGVSYDVFRNEAGCNAGFARIASGLTVTSYNDTTVANGPDYYYQVIAYPTGPPANGACASPPSTCVTTTACPTIAAATGAAAVASTSNQITVTWNDSATSSVTSYDVLRSDAQGGPYAQVGNVPDSGGGPWSFQDNTVSGGSTYFYVVRANASVAPGTCRSVYSSEVSATATGNCTLSPTFSGLQSVTNLGGGQGCGLRLSWSAATAQCGAVTYAVYRSTTFGFTPAPANLVASCVAGTTWDDTTMPLDTTAFYVVRAEDASPAGSGPCNGGNMDANVAQAFGYASTTGSGTMYSNTFETGSGLADWAKGTFNGGSNADWLGIQACTAHGGANIFRFGGSVNCTSNYADNDFTFAQPNGSAGILVPSGSTTVRLNFWHRWNFENGWDGGILAVSLNGSNYTLVPASAILSNSYNGTTDGGAGYPAWTGTQATFVNTVVNLDAACTAAGAVSGCAGQAVRIGFVGYSDGSLNDNGWYLDDVTVTRDAVAACTPTPPNPVQVVTATGKSGQATVEWVNPASGSFASTRIRTATASPPADPTAGTLVANVAGTLGSKGTTTHSPGGGSNGVVQYYSAFANNGSGLFSGRRTVAGLPVDTTGNLKWDFSTVAAVLAPPIQGWGLGVFATSNDRFVHAMQPGAGGGIWPASWKPGAMNGPAQNQPLVMPAASTGLAFDAVFVGSQDGYVYCFDAATGAGCSGWSAGGRSADPAGFGMVQAPPMLHTGSPKLLLFGSRNASATNGFYALNVTDGSTAWAYTNTVGQGGDGTAMGIVSSPAFIDSTAGRVYFTSRTRAGSTHTVWALNFGSSSASLAWVRDLGDIDGAVTQDWTNNLLLVGTNSGSVYALNPATSGSTSWSRALGDGAVKSMVYYDPAASPARLYLATQSKVWGIPASGATGDDWSAALSSPTRPLLHFGTGRVYVGACNDGACANGRLVELSPGAWGTPKTYDLVGFGGLGPVTIDRTQSPALLHAGSRSGRVVAVQVPLP